MALSKLTVAELRTTAMLLGAGWEYDPTDHTFCNTTSFDTSKLIVLDADTMERLYMWTKVHFHRIKAVKDRKLGAVDYIQFALDRAVERMKHDVEERPIHRQDGGV